MLLGTKGRVTFLAIERAAISNQQGTSQPMAKYQVFVSSTYRDLQDERELVIKAVLEMGHIPVGMEMFSAADEEQWNIITKQIDQSDYYVVVVAHRYGSCEPTGLSYTEKEYDYAASKGIPTLGFILESDVTWPRERSDTDKTTIKKLNGFKDKIKAKPVSFWRNGEDLYGKCSIALMKAFNAYPREGWVRASQVQDTVASKEVIRLSAENAELRRQLETFSRAANEELAIARTMELLRANKRNITIRRRGSSEWEQVRELTLYQIFEQLAPELQVESDLPTIGMFVASVLGQVPVSELRREWPTPRNSLGAMLADFAALNCIVPSTRKKPIADKNAYWTLGDFGVQLLAHMRRRRLEMRESPVSTESPAKDAQKDE